MNIFQYFFSGFIPPTSGTAYINDKDIRTDIESVRESLGLCPQHNILFGSLSVQEHLEFFAKVTMSKCSFVAQHHKINVKLYLLFLRKDQKSPNKQTHEMKILAKCL